ncbi:hypothetical protein Tco_1025792 [Tanacetum coccineum]
MDVALDVAFYYVADIKDNDGLGTDLWNFNRDILRDMFGHNLLSWDHTSACRNNGFWIGVVFRIIREIELEKDFVLGDFECFVGSFVEEYSFGVENSLRPSFNESFVIELVKRERKSPQHNRFLLIFTILENVTNLKKIYNVSVRIRTDSPIKLIIPNHLHVGSLDTEIIGNIELDYSGTRLFGFFCGEKYLLEILSLGRVVALGVVGERSDDDRRATRRRVSEGEAWRQRIGVWQSNVVKRGGCGSDHGGAGESCWALEFLPPEPGPTTTWTQHTTQVQETPLVSPIITLPPPSVSTIPPVPHQTTTPIPTPPIITESLTITTVVHESDALTSVQLRVAKLEKDVSDLKKIDLSTEALATLKSQVPNVVDEYLGSKLGDTLQKTLQKHSVDLIQTHSMKPAPESSKIQTLIVNLKQGSEKSDSEILKIKREQNEKQKMPKYTIKSTNKAALKEYDQKSTLYQTMHENKSFNKNPANHALYHAIMKALIEDENAMDKGVADTVNDHKRKHDDDDDDRPAGPYQGSKTGKSASAKEPVKEPIAEVVMDDEVNTAGEDVVRDDDQPQDTLKPKTNKTPNPEWFKQPPRPPTPDLEWNKRQVILG